ncbi:hypothetical protein AWV80_10325 [Cupriavidus sp. UYMU48A]|nr:hypothetical protein AWV80_10325 [Cupriavidus sp. UYMU48A]
MVRKPDSLCDAAHGWPFGAGRVLRTVFFSAFGIVVLVKVWQGQASMELRWAAVAAATLLITPYLWFYDLTWLGIAIAAMTVDCVRRGWMKGERELLSAAWLLPFLLGINKWFWCLRSGRS